MNTVTNSPVMLYTEQTPNPETLKYVTNRMLYKGTAEFADKSLAEEWSPLATALYEKFPFVKGVYICNNFVTITKEFNFDWAEVMLPLKEYLKDYVTQEKQIVKDGFEEAKAKISSDSIQNDYSGEDGEMVKKIKDLIDTYVKPAVESDGGNIEFQSFNKGIVTVVLQGACSGCPSSTVTLKSGIEGMLKRMVPEVKEVVAEMG